MSPRSITRWSATLAALAAALFTAGCGDDGRTVGVDCSDTVEVATQAELTSAASSAKSGTCILLDPATYGAVTLHGGVRLLGDGDDSVTVGSITVEQGQGTVVRGMRVAGRIDLDAGVHDADLSHVTITGGPEGVRAGATASFTLSDATISGTASAGVVALDAARVTLVRTSVSGTHDVGLWLSCEAGCGCASRPQISLTDVALHENAVAAAVFAGADVDIHGLEVLDPQGAPNFALSSGISAIACANVTATGLHVEGAESYGMLLDHASGILGQGEANGIIIINSKGGGLATQNMDPSQSVAIDGALLSNNSVFGVDIGGGSHGIIIINSRVENTQLLTVPSQTWVGDEKVATMDTDIGDGLLWSAGADAKIESLTVADSGRNAFLIDGEVGAGSSVAGVTLEGADAMKGLVQQHVSSPAQAPQVSSSPALQQLASDPNKTPTPLAAPASVQ